MFQAMTIPATGTNRILVVATFIYHSSGELSVSGVTYNGVAMTAAGAGYGTISDSGQLRYWYLLNPPTGSSYNIVATLSGAGTCEEMAIMAQAFSDVDQTTPFGSQVGTNGTNSAASTGTVSLAGSDIALAVWSGYDAAGAYTITPNGTGIVEDENGNFNTTLGFQSRTNATLGWAHSVSVDSFQQLSIPLKHAAGGGSAIAAKAYYYRQRRAG
jgi:hypothetical protein